MQIRVIFFLRDAFFEDQVIQTLISPELPDLQLEYRAISRVTLLDYLSKQEPDNVRRILLHDAIDLDIEVQRQRLGSLISLYLDPGDLARVRTEVTRALRNFQPVEKVERTIIKRKNLVAFTGTTGAPGITTSAINVAHELSLTQQARLIDRDPRRNDIAFLLGGKRNENEIRLTQSLTISQDAYLEGGVNIADCGSAPDLNSAISDRRSQARIYSDLIDSATKIVFVLQPENNLLFELERFIEACRTKLVTAKPIFVVNQLSDSQRQRSIFRRCQARIGETSLIAAPLELSSLERAKAQYAPLADVAPRSKLRRSYRELASLLIE